MIQDRPSTLLAQSGYKGLPTSPFGVDLVAIPERVRASLGNLGGIQPITGAMAAAAGGALRDKPSSGEIELHRTLGTRFQSIYVVLSVAAFRDKDGTLIGAPYAVSLIPASKRGTVQTVSIDFVERIDPETLTGGDPCYLGYDPFRGDWKVFGRLETLMGLGGANCYVDELGVVIDHYFLATAFDEEDVLLAAGGFNDRAAEAKFNKHRNKRFFRPFERVEARRVWGAESPIELFLLQGLLGRGLSPALQMILCDDGTTYGALYHLWRDRHLEDLPSQITDADLYFPDQQLAIFCDSNRHHRGGQKAAKDGAIDERLAAAGFRSLRIRGPDIVRDLGAAVETVQQALQ